MNSLPKGDVAESVRRAIEQLLGSGEVSLSRIARDMATSPRSLQRRLAREETHFGAVVDQVRERLARRYLRDKERTTTEVALLLGFADLSSFSRAFKRWTGESPAAFRSREAVKGCSSREERPEFIGPQVVEDSTPAEEDSPRC